LKGYDPKFDMNLTIILALVPGAMLLYGLAFPKSAIAFWEIAGWIALLETAFLFGFRKMAKRKSGKTEQDAVSRTGGAE